MNKAYLGIDLGTTNSTASVVNVERGGRVVPLTLEVEQVDDYGLGTTYNQVVPSALFVDENGYKSVGFYALKMLEAYPQNVMKETKRHIGVLKDGKGAVWNINGDDYTPEIVSSYVLKKLKKEAEKYLQQDVDSVVITVPANFNFNQVGATRTAAKLAGFDENKIHMLAEPTAALMDYLNEERQKDASSRRLDITKEKKRLLVFDLGGGTCDISILEAKEDQDGTINIQELSISQYTELGGLDFDQAVVQRLLLPQLMKAKGISPQALRKIESSTMLKLLSGLKRIAENSKKYFAKAVKSRSEMDDIDYFENSEMFDNVMYKEMIIGLPAELTHRFEITKKQYDECIKMFLYASASQGGKDIETPILNALQTAKKPLNIADIDQIFLVGGMTNYPTIQKRIYEIFDNRLKPISSINPMLSVSRGAAVFNYYKEKVNFGSGEEDSMGAIVDVNILPGNVFIDVVAGEPICLLEKGTEAGSSKILDGQFEVAGKAGQDKIAEMELRLFTAESATSMKVTELKSAILKFRRPVDSGSKISIKAEYTANREVIVSAWLTNNEEEKIDVVVGSSQLSKEQEENIKKDTVK